MKKVGIMSMHRIINYGSYLQAFGLKITLEELGNCVEFVDYHYEGSFVKEPSKIEIIWNKAVRAFKTKNYIFAKKSFLTFQKEIHNALTQIGVTEKNYNKQLDCLVIGSDEVFNCMQGYPVGYSRELFGYGFEHTDVISYAASFGFTTLDRLEQAGVKNEVGSLLSKFKAISVRDDNSEEIVCTLVGNPPERHLDPVLISNYGGYMKECCSLDNFIIVYAYNGRLTKEEEKEIKAFAKKKNKKIVSLGFYQAIADYNIKCHPLGVFDYFRKADFVITDTFHGTVFSIKMNTPFGTLIRESNSNKLTALLDQLHLKERAVSSIQEVYDLYDQKMDFSDTNRILEEERKKSIRYLQQNIQ